jgi:hypothetical protein
VSVPAAILALIETAVDPVTVYDGRVPDGTASDVPPSRYVAAYIADPHRLAENVAHESSGGPVRWQVTCVAPDREMASWLASRVRDALLDQRPVAAGWDCGLIIHAGSQRPRPDEQVQERPVVLVTDQYEVLVERLTAVES